MIADQNNGAKPNNKPKLFEFAYLRNIDDVLESLKDLAMEENWEYTNTINRKKLPILYNYLLHTFARIEEEGKIAYIHSYACFNTGLATDNQQDIFMLLKKSSREMGGYYFVEFCKESDNNLRRFSSLPERATYFTDPSELIFDTRLDLRINIDHIVNDPNNFSRFPDTIKKLPSLQLINTFNGAIEHAKKRIRRNYKTAIPQYYRTQTYPGKLQLLLPLCLTDHSKADLALTVFNEGTFYDGRTCLTLDMAINNARLIAKPDDEWLRP